MVFRYDGEVITVAADNGRSAETSALIRSAYPAPPGRRTVAGRALLERRVIAMTNAQDSRENPDGAERARALGYRAGLSVPMMRGDVAIGAINVVRVEAMPFTHAQIELLKTFADQAVIAIENVRLFTELQDKNKSLIRPASRSTRRGTIHRHLTPRSTAPTRTRRRRTWRRRVGSRALLPRYPASAAHEPARGSFQSRIVAGDAL